MTPTPAVMTSDAPRRTESQELLGQSAFTNSHAVLRSATSCAMSLPSCRRSSGSTSGATIGPASGPRPASGHRCDPVFARDCPTSASSLPRITEVSCRAAVDNGLSVATTSGESN